MRSIVLPFVGLFLLGLILYQRPAFGQSRTSNLGGSSSSGSFGSRSLGGGVSGGTRNFGGAGSGAMGQLGAGTQIGDNMPTGIGEVDSSDRFVRDARAPGQFVGSDTGEMQGFLGSVQSGAGSGRNQGGLQGLISAAQNRGNATNRQGNNRGGRGTTDVRTSLRVAFSYTRTSPEQISTTVARRLEKSQRIRTLSAVQVHLENGTATLRGVVATDHDRVLAERLTRLEAGIWRVKNELTVAQQPAPDAGDTPTDEPSADTPREPAAVPASPSPSPPEPPRLELPRGN